VRKRGTRFPRLAWTGVFAAQQRRIHERVAAIANSRAPQTAPRVGRQRGSRTIGALRCAEATGGRGLVHTRQRMGRSEGARGGHSEPVRRVLHTAQMGWHAEPCPAPYVVKCGFAQKRVHGHNAWTRGLQPSSPPSQAATGLCRGAQSNARPFGSPPPCVARCGWLGVQGKRHPAIWGCIRCTDLAW